MELVCKQQQGVYLHNELKQSNMEVKLRCVQGYKYLVNISCVKVDPVLNAPENGSL